jgi:hypothetical protein
VTVRRAAGGAASKRSVASAQTLAREPRAAHTWSTGARKPSHVLLQCDVRQQAMSSTVLRLAKVCFSLRLRDCALYLASSTILTPRELVSAR